MYQLSANDGTQSEEVRARLRKLNYEQLLQTVSILPLVSRGRVLGIAASIIYSTGWQIIRRVPTIRAQD